MAITWGAAVYSGGNGFRVGYEFTQSPSTIGSGTTTATVTCTLYGQTQYYAWDSGANWTISNQISASGTTSFNVTSGTSWSSANIFKLGSGSRTVTTSTTSTVTTSISGSLTGLSRFSGLTARCSGSWTTAKRPLSAPAAPSGCTATRVSDTNHTVSWTNNSPGSSTAPYQHIEVQRQTDGGTWTTVATVGVVTSWSDATTSSNHKYAWRVRSTNTAGASSYSSATTTLSTTPAAPGVPVPTKGATSIALTWSNDPPFATGIQVWHAANGVWDGAALATLAGTATSYTHSSPSTSVTHAYRLAATTTTPALTGPYSGTSTTVALSAPPNAPTNLAPASVARDATTAIALTWQHNPVDTAPQTKYQVQHRVVGAGSWTVGSITSSSTSSFTLPANTYTNGQQIEWQVRTWGQASTGGSDGTGASAFSTSALITMSTTPSASIVSPAPTRNVTDGVTTASSPTVTSATANFTNADTGSSITGGSIPAGATILTVNSATSVTLSANASASATGVSLTITDIYQIAQMIVDWTYFDPEGTTQQQAIATLYGAGMTVLEQRTIAGAATEAIFNTPVANGGSYTVGVKVQDGSGLWSNEAQQAFTVTYSQPPQPDFTLEWYSPSESVSLAINNPPTGVGQVDAVSTEVWRSIGGGPWVLIQSFAGLATSTIDYIPDLVQTNTYKIVAVSALPSRVESATVSITAPNTTWQGVVVSGGPNFSQAVRLPYNPGVNRAPGRNRTLNRFAGRTKPLEFTGDQRENVITVTATLSNQLVDTATFSDLQFVSDLPGPACYRDPSGVRTFVSMGTPQMNDTLRALSQVTWTLTETDYTETVAGSTYTVGFGVFTDDDGAPYYDPYRRNLIALDVDGVPYIVSGD